MAEASIPRVEPEFFSFIERVREEFRPQRIILFGSRARDDHLLESDYDLVLVSEAFRGVPWLERAPRVLALWDLKRGLEVLAYTPEEFEERRKELGIVQQAIEDGVEL